MIPLDIVPVPPSGPWPDTGTVELVATLVSTGLLGMGLSDITAGITDRFSGDDDEVEDFSGGDGFDDGGGFGDDFMDGDGGDDEFGDMDDWDDEDGDEFRDMDDFGGDSGDAGGGGGGASDLEPRLNELENELSSISSTMGTVRSENEAVQESVEDIEDNIRKLLEIYEMVTRGVNPFADEVEGSAGMGGSFGLFDGDGGSDGGGEEDLDPDIAEADADSFFDDDWEDDDVDDDGFDDAEFDDDFADAGDDGAEEASGDGESGKTFDELKSEYEEGDPDWSEGQDASGDDPAGIDDAGTVEDALSSAESATEELTDAAPGGSDEPVEAAHATSEDGAELEEQAASTADGDDVDLEEGAGGEATDADPDDAPGSTSNGTDGKPYLQTLPNGYGADMLVMEWLSYLRGCSDTAEALRAIRYYENIGWVGEPAAEALTQFLTGMKGEEGGAVPGGGTQLTVDHHTNSLRYIGRLTGADVQIERLDWGGSSKPGARLEGGEQRGIQR